MPKYWLILIIVVSVLCGGCSKKPTEPSWLEQRCVAVLRQALNDENPTVVNHAGEALIFAGYPEGLEDTFLGLLNRDEPDHRKRDLQTILAARGLYKLGRKEYITRVLEILNDPTSDHRHTAAETLGKLKYSQAAEQIRIAIADEQYVNSLSMWAYGTGALAKCGDQDAIARMLRQGFTSEHWNVRRITANDLSSIRLSAALPHIRTMVAQEQHEMTRVDAAGALLQYEDFSGMDILLTAIQSPEPGIRRHAVRVFNPVTDKAYIELLEPFLEDPDPDTRVMAAEAILRIMRNTPNGNRSLF